jgi:hypothetical protein
MGLLGLGALTVVWFIFSWVFNYKLKDWFSVHWSNPSLLPLLFYIFLGNSLATGLWAMHVIGWRGSSSGNGRRAVELADVRRLLHGNRIDLALMCASGIVGVAASVVVMQFGSIQLVQVCVAGGACAWSGQRHCCT